MTKPEYFKFLAEKAKGDIEAICAITDAQNGNRNILWEDLDLFPVDKWELWEIVEEHEGLFEEQESQDWYPDPDQAYEDRFELPDE